MHQEIVAIQTIMVQKRNKISSIHESARLQLKHKRFNGNLVDMPPILASVIDPLPDYRHNHLVFMTAETLKMSFSKKLTISSIKESTSKSLLVSGCMCNICKKCSMRTPGFIAGSIKNLEAGTYRCQPN